MDSNAPASLNVLSPRSRVAVAWTGGKDSVLALHLIHEHMPDCVKLLVTFVPPGAGDFKAHPMPVMQAQAKELDLPYVQCAVSGQPSYLESYREQIARLHSEHGIDVLCTGDILDVCDGFMSKVRRHVVGASTESPSSLWRHVSRPFQLLCASACTHGRFDPIFHVCYLPASVALIS